MKKINRILIKYDFLFYFMYSCLILLMINNSSLISLLKTSYSILTPILSIFSFFITIFFIFNQRFSQSRFLLLLFFLFFSTYTFLNSFYRPNPYEGFKRAFMIATVFSVTTLGYHVGEKEYSLKLSHYIKIFLTTLHFLLFFYLALQIREFKFSGFLANPNCFGNWIALTSFYVFDTKSMLKSHMLLYISMVIVLITASQSRTAFLAFIVGLLILFISDRKLYNKYVTHMLIFTLFLFSFSAVYLTLKIDLTQFNAISQEISTKNITSGRNIIWPTIISKIKENPLFGFGSGSGMETISTITLSAHNSYLQTLLQGGYIGLSLKLLLICYVFKLINSIKGSLFFKPLLANFACLIIIQNFEVSMFQNNLALSLPFWYHFGFGYGYFHKYERGDILTNEKHNISSSITT